MALRWLSLYGLSMCILLAAVASAVDPGSPSPQAVAVLASDDCYDTMMGVPRWCAGQFIRAVFSGSNRENSPVSFYCCKLLSCVHQWSCYSLITGVCPPPETNQCWPPAARTGVDDRHRK